MLNSGHETAAWQVAREQAKMCHSILNTGEFSAYILDHTMGSKICDVVLDCVQLKENLVPYY